MQQKKPLMILMGLLFIGILMNQIFMNSQSLSSLDTTDYSKDIQTNIQEENSIQNSQIAPISAATANKWTIMVYIDGDNNLESAAIDDLNEMEQIGGSADVDIVVQIDRISSYDTSNGDWTGTKRYLISKDMSQSTIGSTEKSDLDEINMGSGTSLENFVDWAQSNYPATNYALILWDHGSGAMYGSSIGGICWDDTNSHDYLTPSEIGDAIDGKGIDLLGMDACLMASTEIWYMLADYTDVFVGSEKTEPGDGWPYDTIIDWIISNPTATASQFGDAIVDKYQESYLAYEGYGIYVTQSAVTASGLVSVNSALNTLASAMISNIGSYKSTLETIRGIVYEYDDEPYIDLYDFANRIETNIPALSSETSALRSAITAAVINSQYTGDLVGSNGLTIYFPATSGEYSGSYASSAFGQASQWDEFLLSYYGSSSTDDQFEDNDYFDTATSLNPGYYTGLICNDDDYYNITVSLGDVLSLQLEHSYQSGIADLDLYLVFPNGTSLVSETTTNIEHIEWTANADMMICIGVINYEGDGNHVSYTLSIYIPIEDDMYEENDYFNTATDIDGMINSTLSNLVCIDLDFYNFTAVSNALISVNLTYRAANGFLNLYLCDSTSSIVATVSSPDDNEFYQFSVQEDELYSIVVENYENNTNYNLTVIIDEGADDFYDFQGTYGNDYVYSETPVLTPGNYNDLVCIDSDYYNVSVNAGEWLNITIYFEDDQGDLDLYLFDWHSQYSIDSSGYWVDNEYIIYNCTETGLYTFRVDPYEINLHYNLSIEISTGKYFDDAYDPLPNDNIEENATFSQLSINAAYTNLSAWDEDWYKVNLEYAEDYVFQLEYPETNGTLVLLLYSSNGLLIDYSFTDSPNEYLQYSPSDYFYSYQFTSLHYIRILPLQRMAGYDLSYTTVPDLTIDFSSQISGDLSINFSELVENSDLISYFYWEFGDGESFEGMDTTLSHTYDFSGVYTVYFYVVMVYGDYYVMHEDVHVYSTPTPAVISLVGESPVSTSTFTIAWASVDATGISVYISEANITGTADAAMIGQMALLTEDTTGNAISVEISVTASGTYYFVMVYENPLGEAYSNILAVEVSLNSTDGGDTTPDDKKVPGYDLYLIIIGGFISILLVTKKIHRFE